ncbi:MAG TPA: DUF6603 domain-containing protein [Gemmatimonadaceae bacterium]|nr:DUF6603 domain-containing protein [Gemmatimonadaceae bacterium]
MADDPKKTPNIFSRIISWFKSTATWVEEHLGDPAIAQSIREDLGLQPGQDIAAATKGKFAQYGAGIDPDKEGFSETVAELTAIIPDLKALATTFETDKFPANQLLYTLLSLSATDSVRLHAPTLFALCRLALWVEEDLESLTILDPAKLLRNVRGQDLPSGEALVQRISDGGALLLQILDMKLEEQHNPEKPGVFDIFSGWDPSPDSVTPKADLVSTRATTLHIGSTSDTNVALLVTILAVPTEHGGPGLLLSFGGSTSIARESDTARLKIDAGFPGAFDMFIPFGDSKTPFTVKGGELNPFFKFTIGQGDQSKPAFRIGEPNGTRLDVYQTELGITVSNQTAGVHAAFTDAELVIAAGSAGGFLSEIVGDGARVKFSGGLLLDTDGGFRLDGGTNLHASLPIGRSIAGVLTVHDLNVGLGPSSTGGDLGLEISGGFTATLGPFKATVDRLGFQLDLDRRDNGNLGPFNVDLGFKRPNGLGLSIDSDMVTGGGYLFADPVNHEFAGALELKFGKLMIKAIGMLTDGEEGWSLLLLLYAQFPAIQLGVGFTLNGLGGLVGVQRGIDVTKLALALKTKAFDDILFPDNPVADAPRIINELRSFFPFSARSLTIGPMVDIGWGTPRILFIRVAVLFQINDVFHRPLGAFSLARIVLVGELKLLLGPTKADASQAVVKLIVDVLGFWDLEQEKYGFLATLRDSKIATIDITGGLIVYGQYGEKSQFILAAGGFNPRFTDVPPEAKASVDRLGAAFKVGRFSLKLAGYFALTPGTIQAGFDITAQASIGPVGLKGELGFDVIVFRDPKTHFIADFRFSAAITYSGHTLAGVSITGSIEGPGAWHIKGKVTFTILFWDISKSFDEKWGTLPAVPVVTTDVKALLVAEIARPDNWSTALPPASDAMVTLAPQVGETLPIAHPFSQLSFRQTAVPLGLTLEKYGDTPIAGINRFDITKVTVNGTAVASPTFVQEHFARAQFLNMSDEDKLTKPSFEAMSAGVEFSSTAYHISASSLSFPMEYETVYLDIDPLKPGVTRPETALTKLRPSHDQVQALAVQGAAARAPQRIDEKMTARTTSQVAVTAAPLAVISVDALVVDPTVPITGQAATVTMIAEQRLKPADLNRAQLVEAFECATW